MTQLLDSHKKITSTKPLTNEPAQVDELLTIAEVATYLKVSRRTAWRWCKSGRLSASKIGHQWRVARSDLEKFIHR